MGGGAVLSEDCAAIQRYLDRLEKKVAHRNLMQFGKGKSKVLQLRGRDNPRHQDMLGVLVDTKG